VNDYLNFHCPSSPGDVSDIAVKNQNRVASPSLR
jgi:hypothetical protein